MDGGYCDACVRGENRQRASRVARSRRWSYRRRLVADAAYVRVRSFADIRRGAHAVPWVDRRLGLTPLPTSRTPMSALGHKRKWCHARVIKFPVIICAVLYIFVCGLS